MEFAARQINDKNIINDNTKTADTKNPDINKILKELECWFKQLKESIKTSDTQETNISDEYKHKYANDKIKRAGNISSVNTSIITWTQSLRNY